MTLKVVAEALQYGHHHHHSNEKTCGEWIKDYNSEASVRALGKSQYYQGQGNWLGKNDKFQVALSTVGQRHPFKCWMKMLKTHI